MRSEKIKQSILSTIVSYRTKFAGTSDAEFTEQPPMGGWSYSEVYAHIFDASLLSLHALKNCSSAKAEEKPSHFLVKVILFFGSFPPGKKYKVPKVLANRVKKISKTDAALLMDEVEKELEFAIENIKIAQKNKKIKHPRLGYLNAKQWFRFVEIHLKHHLKQLHRIENSFKQRI